MSNLVRERVCRVCGATYMGFASRMYCSKECRTIGRASVIAKRRRKKESEDRPQQRVMEKPSMTVADVMRWIQRHYEETGVLLSYGKAVVKIEGGKNNG